MPIKWHRRARQDLKDVKAYIAEENPKAAVTIAPALLKAVEQVADNPGIGRPGRVMDTREFVVTGTPYLIPYRVVGDVVVILRVLPRARQWPRRFEK